MRVLQLTCKSCGGSFDSGIPLRREHVDGVKLRALEICPACGMAADYAAEDYRDPAEAPDTTTASPRARCDIPAAGG